MLVDLHTVRNNLRLPDDTDDDNLVMLLEQASAIVLDYLKVPLDSYQDANGVPQAVPLLYQAATILVFRSLHDTPENDPITPAVVSILMRSRDPAIA